ncbi:MAG: response regulator [Cytophagales bacterium]|nr:response regulator [Armatimonadota bacterium]
MAYNQGMDTHSSLTADGKTLLLVADDLMFPSRIREGARPLGYRVIVAGTEAAALQTASSSPAPAAILVNLSARRCDPPAVIRALKTNETTRGIPLLAFAGHVEKEKHDEARAAGADQVAANSSVSLHLDLLLNRLLGTVPASADAEALEEV